MIIIERKLEIFSDDTKSEIFLTIYTRCKCYLYSFVIISKLFCLAQALKDVLVVVFSDVGSAGGVDPARHSHCL